MLPPAANWYASNAASLSDRGLLAYGANNTVILVDIVHRYGTSSRAQASKRSNKTNNRHIFTCNV